MKMHILATGVIGLAACASPSDPGGPGSGSATTHAARAPGAFLPVGSMKLGSGDGAPVQPGRLAVPVRRFGGVCIAVLHIADPTIWPGTPASEIPRVKNEISPPENIVYWDARTNDLVARIGTGAPAFREEHFGLRDPDGQVVGHFDDPSWLPKARLDLLQRRIFAGLDVLLPFFADEHLPWTEAANKAAQEVRDFFPLAAEPGLWPYYKAEGREFFAWVEKNAPPGKARLPWDDEKK